ncbi:hypothetical protein JCM19236_538 [Vibrio sp. JCM 19236]|nr:hypothetical protein JCM19236_538 [Vibrio sp. JCM 19236]
MDSFNKQNGFAAVETVVVTPILILLFVIIVDVGRVMYHSLSTAAAARAAAAYGAQSTSFISDAAGMASIAKQDGVSLGKTVENPDIFIVNSSQYCICVNGSTKLNGCVQSDLDSCGSGYERYVSVTVGRTFETLMNYQLVPSTIALSETAVLRVE